VPEGDPSTGDLHGRAPTDLNPPVTAADALVAVFRSVEALVEALKQRYGVGVKFSLVSFEREHVVCSLIGNADR